MSIICIVMLKTEHAGKIWVRRRHPFSKDGTIGKLFVKDLIFNKEKGRHRSGEKNGNRIVTNKRQ